MMFRISKPTLSWAGVAVAAILFTLAVPRAAHAVAAALVQVTNTASSPVISQGIGNQAAQMVEIECGFHPPNGNSFNNCFLMPPTGIVPSPLLPFYRVPAGQTLVVTSVDILSGVEAGSPCMSPAFPYVLTTPPIFNGGSSSRGAWIVPAGTGTAHYVYPSGILFLPDTLINDVFNGTSTTCTLTLDMYGYLTAQ